MVPSGAYISAIRKTSSKTIASNTDYDQVETPASAKPQNCLAPGNNQHSTTNTSNTFQISILACGHSCSTTAAARSAWVTFVRKKHDMVPSGAYISAIRKASSKNNSVKHRLRPSRDYDQVETPASAKPQNCLAPGNNQRSKTNTSKTFQISILACGHSCSTTAAARSALVTLLPATHWRTSSCRASARSWGRALAATSCCSHALPFSDKPARSVATTSSASSCAVHEMRQPVRKKHDMVPSGAHISAIRKTSSKTIASNTDYDQVETPASAKPQNCLAPGNNQHSKTNTCKTFQISILACGHSCSTTAAARSALVTLLPATHWRTSSCRASARSWGRALAATSCCSHALPCWAGPA